MGKLRWLSILMAAVMIVITGFQVYWLKDNYNREKLALETRTNLLFRETVQHLEDSLLREKLSNVLKDSAVKMVQAGRGHQLFKSNVPMDGALKIISTMKRDLNHDSMIETPGDNRPMIRSLSREPGSHIRDSSSNFSLQLDSIRPESIRQVVVFNSKKSPGSFRKTATRDQIMVSTGSDSGHQELPGRIETIFINNDNGEKVMIRIDSLLNDSIPIQKVAAEFALVLKEQRLDIPFTVLRQPGKYIQKEDFIRRPAFTPTARYSLQLEHLLSFLLRKISMPILFSFFLVGITLLSFILLYRSLLRQHRLAVFKNDLISNITHELKTPIATVGVAIEALKNFNAIKDTRKTDEYLEISRQELQRLALLVDKVLKLSMFENKKVEISVESVNLGDLVDEVVESLRLQLEKYHAAVSIHTEGDLHIGGDRLHLLSVVFNLLDNALKYSRDKPEITIGIRGQEKSVILKVSDNGIGIPAAYLDKIFEKFFRVPAGNTHNAKGHGLGLSYSAQVIRQHRGTISVESVEGAGSTFTITIPKQNT